MRKSFLVCLLISLFFVSSSFSNTLGEKVGQTKAHTITFWENMPNWIYADGEDAWVAYTLGDPAARYKEDPDNEWTIDSTDFKVQIVNVKKDESYIFDLSEYEELALYGLGKPSITKGSDGAVYGVAITGAIPWYYLAADKYNPFLFMESEANSREFSIAPIMDINSSDAYTLNIKVTNNGVIHLLSHHANMTYLRSEDGGFSFSPLSVTGEELELYKARVCDDSEVNDQINKGIRGCAMAVTDDGSKVVLVAQDEMCDVAYMESTDGGKNFSASQKVFNYDGIPSEGDPDNLRPHIFNDVIYDNNGNFHIVFEAAYFMDVDRTNEETGELDRKNRKDRYAHQGTADNIYLAAKRERIMHFSVANGVSTATVSIAPNQDLNYDKYCNLAGDNDAYAGQAYTLAFMPSIAVDPSTGYLYMVYTQCSEDDAVLLPKELNYAEKEPGDSTYWGFGEIYLTYSTDNGKTWAFPQNLTNTFGHDERFPCLNKKVVNGKICMSYVSKDAPGLRSWAEMVNYISDDYEEGDICYAEIAVDEIIPTPTIGTKLGETKVDVFAYYENHANYIWTDGDEVQLVYTQGDPNNLQDLGDYEYTTDFKVEVASNKTDENLVLDLHDNPDFSEFADWGHGSGSMTQYNGLRVIPTIPGWQAWYYVGPLRNDCLLFFENEAKSGEFTAYPIMEFGQDVYTIQLSVDAAGNIHMLNSTAQVCYLKSEDGGFSYAVDTVFGYDDFKLKQAVFGEDRAELAEGRVNRVIGSSMAVSDDGSKVYVVAQEIMGDVAYIESTDGGQSWAEAQMVFGYTGMPVEGDSVNIRPSWKNSAILDSDNNLHIVFSASYYLDGSDGKVKSEYRSKMTLANPLFLKDYKDRIMHYSTATGLHEVAVSTAPERDLDLSYLTLANDYRKAFCTQPTMAADENGNLYVAYLQVHEDDAIKLANNDHWIGGYFPGIPFYVGYGDIYITMSKDGGQSWTEAKNLTNTKGYDERFPYMYPKVFNGKVFLAFTGDNKAGANDNYFLGNERQYPATGMYYVELDELNFVGMDDHADNTVKKKGLELSNVYPNPFNMTANIKFTLPEASQVKVDVFNITGQKVSTIRNEKMSAGVHNIQWNGKSDSGRNVPSGVYFVRVKANDAAKVEKMTLLK